MRPSKRNLPGQNDKNKIHLVSRHMWEMLDKDQLLLSSTENKNKLK